MDFLPKDLEDIILDYKYQLEHTEKSKGYLKIFKNSKVTYENRNDHMIMNGTTYIMRSFLKEYNHKMCLLEIAICNNCSKYYYAAIYFGEKHTQIQFCSCNGEIRLYYYKDDDDIHYVNRNYKGEY